MKSQVVIPRAQCITGARAVLDKARQRIAADYAAGRLSPEQTAVYERLIAKSRAAAAA
ncbi:hypothetical protein [Streptomyces roseicoloratus]|uniref:hypothetical protein n=1 Tax=Streptomyces roseicoloratus TaxID=2508722 RepID=UPI0013E92D08|nr:hypothetical protein [Streptomyces roseicoloratus]